MAEFRHGMLKCCQQTKDSMGAIVTTRRCTVWRTVFRGHTKARGKKGEHIVKRQQSKNTALELIARTGKRSSVSRGPERAACCTGISS